MLEWVYWAADQVSALAKSDPEYRELSDRQEDLGPKYEAVLERLSPEDRELILDYTEVATNLEYRTAQLAYEFGKQVGRRQAGTAPPKNR